MMCGPAPILTPILPCPELPSRTRFALDAITRSVLAPWLRDCLVARRAIEVCRSIPWGRILASQVAKLGPDQQSSRTVILRGCPVSIFYHVLAPSANDFKEFG